MKKIPEYACMLTSMYEVHEIIKVLRHSLNI